MGYRGRAAILSDRDGGGEIQLVGNRHRNILVGGEGLLGLGGGFGFRGGRCFGVLLGALLGGSLGVGRLFGLGGGVGDRLGGRDGIPIGAGNLGGIVGTGGQSQQEKNQNGGQPKLTESTHNASYVSVELGTV